MITASDSFYTYDIGRYYVIIPQEPHWDREKFISVFNAKKVQEGFNYNSGTNDEWIDVDAIRALIVEYIDPTFKPDSHG